MSFAGSLYLPATMAGISRPNIETKLQTGRCWHEVSAASSSRCRRNFLGNGINALEALVRQDEKNEGRDALKLSPKCPSSNPSANQDPGRKDGRESGNGSSRATDLGSVRRWFGRSRPRSTGSCSKPRSTLRIFDTYLDTDDWRIHRAGFALRIRPRGRENREATLKSLHSASRRGGRTAGN